MGFVFLKYEEKIRLFEKIDCSGISLFEGSDGHESFDDALS
jgi:hypothetical protein